MNNSQSRLNINAQGDKISSKYGYFGGQKCEQYYTRLNSQRNTAWNSKIISSASIIHSSRWNKENQSRNEKSSSVNKNKKCKQDQQSKPASVKRKKSKSRENGNLALIKFKFIIAFLLKFYQLSNFYIRIKHNKRELRS